jgi:hypothetical protein
MHRSAIRMLTAGVLLAYPAVAPGQEQPPDLKGKWIGKTYAIVAGSGGHHPGSGGTFEKPGLFEKDLVIEVTGQDGRRFWGVTTISAGSDKTDEPFIGVLTGRNNRGVLLADTDGTFNGQLRGRDALSFCYTHAGGKTASTVVSCSELRRRR